MLIEPDVDFLKKGGLEHTQFIALQGEISYCRITSAQALATLVPPFSPSVGAGAPPERASILTAKTDIPLMLLNKYGTGQCSYIPFRIADLVSRFGIYDHLLLVKNLIYKLVNDPILEITWQQGLYITIYKGEGFILLHLLNGAGNRPLVHNLPLCDIEISVCLPNVKLVKALIADKNIEFVNEAGRVKFRLDRLESWECVKISNHVD